MTEHGHLYHSVTLHDSVLRAPADIRQAETEPPMILDCADEVVLDCGRALSSFSVVLQQQVIRQNETRGSLITCRQKVCAVFDSRTGMSRDELAAHVATRSHRPRRSRVALEELPTAFADSALKWMCCGMLPQVDVDRQIFLMAVDNRWKHHPLVVAAYRQAFPEPQTAAAEEDSTGPSF